MGMADCNDDYQILQRMMRVWMGKQSAKILLSTERAPALSHLWFRQPSRRPTINFHKSISRPTRDFPQPWTLGGRASDNLPLTILLSSFSCFFSPFSLSLAFTTLSFHLSPDAFQPLLLKKNRLLVMCLSDQKVQANPSLMAGVNHEWRTQTWLFIYSTHQK